MAIDIARACRCEGWSSPLASGATDGAGLRPRRGRRRRGERQGFNLPADLVEFLDKVDDFTEREIKPLEQEGDNIRFLDHRREDPRTDWDRGGLPNKEWEDLMRTARVLLGLGFVVRLSDAVGHRDEDAVRRMSPTPLEVVQPRGSDRGREHGWVWSALLAKLPASVAWQCVRGRSSHGRSECCGWRLPSPTSATGCIWLRCHCWQRR
jgi:hypothetical protein